jgi:hypothetical protein
VVLPLIYSGTVLGALSFTKETASNFQVCGMGEGEGQGEGARQR